MVMAMERLEAKKISGHTYYYYSGWGWRDGRCRRLWQKYLGKLEDIVRAVECGGPPPAYAEVFEFGLTEALWREAERSQVVETIDRLCPKRDQGLSVGQYLAIAAANRAADPVSKRAMWEWLSATTLLRRASRSRCRPTSRTLVVWPMPDGSTKFASSIRLAKGDGGSRSSATPPQARSKRNC